MAGQAAAGALHPGHHGRCGNDFRSAHRHQPIETAGCGRFVVVLTQHESHCRPAAGSAPPADSNSFIASQQVISSCGLSRAARFCFALVCTSHRQCFRGGGQANREACSQGDCRGQYVLGVYLAPLHNRKLHSGVPCGAHECKPRQVVSLDATSSLRDRVAHSFQPTFRRSLLLSHMLRFRIFALGFIYCCVCAHSLCSYSRRRCPV